MDHDPQPARAGRREWAAMGLLSLPCLLYAMDLTVLNLALPSLSRALNPGETGLLWIVDIYGFVLAAALIPMGVFGDRFGRRRLLLCGALAFGAASLAAAFAPSVSALILARAVMGLAAATLAPSTLSLISVLFRHPGDRRLAIGLWIASFSSGGALGPLIGGVLLEHFWWGSVFLINLPVMAILLALGPRLLPESRDPSGPRPDLVSAAGLLLAILGLVYSIKQMAAHGAGFPAFAGLMVSLLAGAHFFRRQTRLPVPFLDLRMFRSGRFSAALGINIAGFFSAFGMFLLIALHLQTGHGLTPLQAGLCTAPSGLAFIAGALTTPAAAARLSAYTVMTGGFLIAAAGFLLTAAAAGSGHLGILIAGYGLFSFGLAPVFTLTTDVIVASVPAEKAGAAAGLSEASTELGGAFGIAVLGSLMTLLAPIAAPDPAEMAPGAVTARAVQAGAILCCGIVLAAGALTSIAGRRFPPFKPAGDTP